MRILKPLVSVLMALLIGVTSLGLSVSAHTCEESGFSEVSFAALKACCKLPEGKGFQSEPCCKLSVHHIKLPTVRTAVTAVHLPMPLAMPVNLLAAMLVPANADIVQDNAPSVPPESPPLATGRDIQTQFCRFLI
jgi:hypothetical protein